MQHEDDSAPNISQHKLEGSGEKAGSGWTSGAEHEDDLMYLSMFETLTINGKKKNNEN